MVRRARVARLVAAEEGCVNTGELEQFDPAAAGRPSHVLLVEDDNDYADLMSRQLDRSSEVPLTSDRVSTLAEAVEALEAHDYDLVVLDLHLPDETGLRTLRRLRDRVNDVPVVVITNDADPDLALKVIAAGAQELLHKDEITSVLLVKSIRYALERWKLYDALGTSREATTRERELRQLERLASRSTSGVTADVFGQGPLSGRQPGRFREARQEYERILEQGLHERAYRTKATASSDLRSLAAVLGFLNAGPRDVVDLHTEALGHLLATREAGMQQPLVEEGRIRIVELMGYVASYYRSRAIVASRGRDNRRAESTADGKDDYS